MIIITLPDGFEVKSGHGFGQAIFDVIESSDATGDSASRFLGPPRWRASLPSPDAMQWQRGSQWESVVLRLRGTVNRLALHDFSRPVPIGSMRGAPVLAANAAAGATTAVVTATGTLATGDWLQLGAGMGTSQLVKLVEDAAAAGGTINVVFEPPLRWAFGAGTAVTWNKPVAYYRMLGDGPRWSYPKNGLGAGGFALDLLEMWS